MGRFIAIGVGQGDAFFLERSNRTILVDGGGSAARFAAMFRRATGQVRVDILVCTHSDADHARGVLGFLQSGLGCDEIWLPASWLDRLRDLLTRPCEFLCELWREITTKHLPVGRRRLSLSQLGDAVAECELIGTPEHHFADADAVSSWAEDAVPYETLELPRRGCEPRLICPSRCPYDSHASLWKLLHMEREVYRLFRQATLTADLIHKIVLLAYEGGRDILVRWFETSPGCGGGIPGVLVPLNAREVKRAPVCRWSALEYLALTQSNRFSLVFLAPVTEKEPAVLFTADSDLSFSQRIPWSSGMVVTAPHHGAEANKAAYERFAWEANPALDLSWVRSDGRFRWRPGRAYLNTHGARYCTICRAPGWPKQHVEMVATRGRWQPSQYTSRCCCI